MRVRVRPFAERDHTAFARIRSTGEGEPTTPEESRERDAQWDWSRYERVRVVAVDEEDAPLGYSEIYQEPTRFDPRRYFLRLAVDLRMRRRGIGDLIWQRVREELDERSALGVYAWGRDATAGERFLHMRGFREVVRVYSLVRAVATAPLPTPASDERLGRAGVRITALADLVAGDAGALEQAHALHLDSQIDKPTLGRVTAMALDAWLRARVDGAAALPEAHFIAIADGRPVGQCVAATTRSDDVLQIVVTSVLPDYRRRGIARALTLRLHAYARAKGYRELHTSAARQNVAMVALNDALGYVIVESRPGYKLAIPSSP